MGLYEDKKIFALPSLKTVIYIMAALFSVYSLVAILQMIGQALSGLPLGVAFIFPFGTSPLIEVESITLYQAIAVYLVPNLFLTGLAYTYRDVKKVNFKRYVGMVAGFRTWISLMPVITMSLIAGEAKIAVEPVNGANVMILSSGNLQLVFLTILSLLTIFNAFVFADQLTDRVLRFGDLSGKHILSVVTALLVNLLVIHEPGHLVTGFLLGAKITGVGLMFPVGAFTAFASLPKNLISLSIILMGGNTFTLLACFLIGNTKSTWLKHIGIFCGWSTFLNSSIPIALGVKSSEIFVGIGKSSDAALFLSVYAKASKFLAIVPFIVATIYSLVGIYYMVKFLKLDTQKIELFKFINE